MTGLERSTILVVDDVAINIDILVETLGDDYEVRVATDGRSALDDIAAEKPDLILLDIMMPEMDGYEVCRRLKAEPETADIPIIFVTARSDVEDEQKGIELGAVDYISKPFSPPIIKARVRNHLLIKSQRDRLENSISLLQHEKELLQQKADIGIQAGGLAHDMGNILNAASLVKYIPETRPESEAAWQEIRENISYAAQSVDLGIDICRGFTIYLKNIGEDAQEQSVREFLPAIQMYARQFKGKLIQEISDDLPMVKCKGYQIKRVLVNLFVNAMQALKDRADGRIRVRLWSNEDRVLLAIQDNGTGISETVLPDIFRERFTTKPDGTGLGLFLTKQIIDAHGGTVEVNSEVGKGTEFVISLPASSVSHSS